MRLVELASWKGGSIFVNPTAVCAIKKTEDTTCLNMMSGLDIHVKESVLEVARMMSEEPEDA